MQKNTWLYIKFAFNKTSASKDTLKRTRRNQWTLASKYTKRWPTSPVAMQVGFSPPRLTNSGEKCAGTLRMSVGPLTAHHSAKYGLSVTRHQKPSKRSGPLSQLLHSQIYFEEMIRDVPKWMEIFITSLFIFKKWIINGGRQKNDDV